MREKDANPFAVGKFEFHGRWLSYRYRRDELHKPQWISRLKADSSNHMNR